MSDDKNLPKNSEKVLDAIFDCGNLDNQPLKEVDADLEALGFDVPALNQEIAEKAKKWNGQWKMKEAARRRKTETSENVFIDFPNEEELRRNTELLEQEMGVKAAARKSDNLSGADLQEHYRALLSLKQRRDESDRKQD